MIIFNMLQEIKVEKRVYEQEIRDYKNNQEDFLKSRTFINKKNMMLT